MSEIPRVVVTGIGIVSSVGVGCNAVGRDAPAGVGSWAGREAGPTRRAGRR